MVIKPAAEGGPAAVARLNSAADLAWYAAMVADREPFIPGGMLSQQDELIPLPLEPPARFVAEPFVEAGRRGA
jgi:hypothetical protein